MPFFDKGKPLTKEFCEHCKKEIKPGEEMVFEAICPSRGRQFFQRTNDWAFYGYVDNASKYHKQCFLKINTNK